jgi:PAS domain S-box-containing protein
MSTSEVMEGEGRFRGIVEAAGIGLATADLQGRVLSSNPSFRRMLGYSPEDLAHMRLADFTHPDDVAIDSHQLASLVRGEIDQYSLDKRLFTKAGDLLWVHIVVSMLRRSDSEPYTILLIENITDRKHAEEHSHRLIAEQAARAEAEASLEFLNSVLQHMPAGVVIVEAPSGSVLLTNRRINELSASIGEPVTPVDDWENQRTLLDLMKSVALKHAIEKAQIQEPIEVSFMRDDVKSTIRMAAAPVLNREGRVIAAVSTAYDVTASKYAEEALRTSEKLASVGRLAATIAHEINNPLESVTNLLYLLGSDPEADDNSKQMVQLAQEELGRVVHIVRQTLGFYRETTAPVNVVLSQVVNDVLRLYARKIDSRKVAVATDFRTEGAVEAFPGEMRQVISNLVTNALDAFNGDRAGRIVVRIREGKDWSCRGNRGRGVVLMVCDNAGGIKRENMRRIFDPFFSTKGEKGTGLGLWVSHGIVQKHGGKILVRSKTVGNTGTTFLVFLPRRRQAVMKDAA